jgi:hypothetical protein
VAVAAPGTPGPSALDIREATYYRRSYIDPSPAGFCTNATTVSCSNAAGRLWVEQRWYAHRSIPSLLVMEVQVRMRLIEVVWLCGCRLSFPTTVFSRVVQAVPPGGYSTTDTTGSSELPYAVLRLSNDAGGASTDILFANVPLPDGTPYSIRNGSTLVR